MSMILQLHLAGKAQFPDFRVACREVTNRVLKMLREEEARDAEVVEELSKGK